MLGAHVRVGREDGPVEPEDRPGEVEGDEAQGAQWRHHRTLRRGRCTTYILVFGHTFVTTDGEFNLITAVTL